MHGRGESRSLSHDSVLATAEQGPTHSSHQYRILAPTIPWPFPKSRDVKEQATLEPVVPSPSVRPETVRGSLAPNRASDRRPITTTSSCCCQCIFCRRNLTVREYHVSPCHGCKKYDGLCKIPWHAYPPAVKGCLGSSV